MSEFSAFTFAAVLASVPPVAPPDLAGTGDSNAIVKAFEGQTLALTRRGTSVSVIGTAASAEQGCAARLSARSPLGGREWSRIIRWGDLAWTGPAPGAGVTLAFHDPEGRLATDMLAFQPADPGGFVAAVNRLAAGCRGGAHESARVLGTGTAAEQSCHFTRLPGLQLIPAASGDFPSRAVLNVLARETPEAELQLLFERAAPENTGDEELGRPLVAFTFADPRLADMRIIDAVFTLDAKPVVTHRALTVYGDTRMRIIMDPQRGPMGGSERGSFYPRLAGAGAVSLTLLDASRQTKVVLTFDAGPVLAEARRALSAADWSCQGAAPAPIPAAIWEPSE